MRDGTILVSSRNAPSKRPYSRLRLCMIYKTAWWPLCDIFLFLGFLKTRPFLVWNFVRTFPIRRQPRKHSPYPSASASTYGCWLFRHLGVLKNNPNRIAIWKCCFFFWRGENRSTWIKTPRSKGENQQQSH